MNRADKKQGSPGTSRTWTSARNFILLKIEPLVSFPACPGLDAGSTVRLDRAQCVCCPPHSINGTLCHQAASGMPVSPGARGQAELFAGEALSWGLKSKAAGALSA